MRYYLAYGLIKTLKYYVFILFSFTLQGRLELQELSTDIQAMIGYENMKDSNFKGLEMFQWLKQTPGPITA